MLVSLVLLTPVLLEGWCLGTASSLGRRPQLLARPKEMVHRVPRGGRLEAVAVLETAASKALSGGVTGSIAGIAQVLMFMWLRTVMNYQYRHGGDGPAVLKKLWAEGGLRRLYRGLPFAIVQGPLARFGSAASNTLVMSMRDDDVANFGHLPLFLVTIVGSCMTAVYRAALMPIDTLKIVSQVEGKAGFAAVVEAAFLRGKLHLLYTGAFAMAAATLLGHFPWFFTFNLLDATIPKQDRADLRALRSACVGFSSSVVSDVVSNPIRVVKTTKQSTAAKKAVASLRTEEEQGGRKRFLWIFPNLNRSSLPTTANSGQQQGNFHNNVNSGKNDEGLPLTADSYAGIVRHIASTYGVQAFFFRGLSTRLVTNGLQSIVFTVIWRFLLEV